MRFPVDALFGAFKVSGMLVDAVYQPAPGPATPFSVNWVQPDQLVLGDDVQSTEYLIEYETASVPRLVKGDAIEIDGEAYRARGPAQKQGDGYFSRCPLDKVRA